jgi:hypothetical protein
MSGGCGKEDTILAMLAVVAGILMAVIKVMLKNGVYCRACSCELDTNEGRPESGYTADNEDNVN